MSEILQQMDIPEAKNDGSYAIEKHASLISVLSSILNAPRAPLVGISVLEVLNTLFSLLIKTLPPALNINGETTTAPTESIYAQAIHEGIIHSIGGLASQIYYQNQMNDMIGYLVAKLRPNTTLDQVEGIPIGKYRRVTLKCLEQIVSALDEFTDSEKSSIEQQGDRVGAYVAPVSWTPAIALLTDKRACMLPIIILYDLKIDRTDIKISKRHAISFCKDISSLLGYHSTKQRIQFHVSFGVTFVKSNAHHFIHNF